MDNSKPRVGREKRETKGGWVTRKKEEEGCNTSPDTEQIRLLETADWVGGGTRVSLKPDWL